MRRLARPGLGPVLIALGAFLLVTGVLVRVYAYPTLARVPANYDSMTYLAGTDVTIFDSSPDVLKPITTDLAISSHTVAGDYPDAPSGTVVWANSTTVKRADGGVFKQSTELSPFDAVTGAATGYGVGFNSASATEKTSVTRTGQVYKFPFDTQKKDYQQWDGDLGKATTATYVGTTKIQGTTVYKFVQTIAPTQIGTIDVPGSIFGDTAPTVTAQMMYGMTRTLFIEPNTGSPVDRIDDRNQYLSYQGTDVPAFVGTVRYTPATVTDVLDTIGSQDVQLRLARFELPVGLGVVGLLMVGGGVVLSRRSRTATPAGSRSQEMAGV